ncbi:MAG: M55 family metallopeptidase, partial [Chromatocurvus sp.]
MEGVSGNVTRKQTDDYSSPEYAAACLRMQDDVLAAVEACRQAGAAEIVVADSHGPGTNLDPDAFGQDTSLVQGWPRPLNMMQGIEQGHYAAAILIGHHASINSTEGGYPHSFSSGHFHAVRINGTLVSEGLVNCAVAGHFGIPVVAISGDDACVAELRQHMPDLEAAVTKKSHGMYAATQVARPFALIAINEAVSRGLQKPSPQPLQ